MKPRKPRLFIEDGVWLCKRDCEDLGAAGFGVTPAEAYADWIWWNDIGGEA